MKNTITNVDPHCLGSMLNVYCETLGAPCLKYRHAKSQAITATCYREIHRHISDVDSVIAS